MEKYHPIGKAFDVTFVNGFKVRIVVREAPVVHDKRFHKDFRVTCKGCFFCKLKQYTCCGVPYYDEICKLGGCKNAKCSPEFREDGKFVHYKHKCLL